MARKDDLESLRAESDATMRELEEAEGWDEISEVTVPDINVHVHPPQPSQPDAEAKARSSLPPPARIAIGVFVAIAGAAAAIKALLEVVK